MSEKTAICILTVVVYMIVTAGVSMIIIGVNANNYQKEGQVSAARITDTEKTVSWDPWNGCVIRAPGDATANKKRYEWCADKQKMWEFYKSPTTTSF